MRILLANHHLAQRAGSELYTLELATGLHQRGHQVAAYTFETGGISERMVRGGIPVFALSELASAKAFAPDIVHSHHAPTLYLLAASGIRARYVHSILGPKAALEGPPLVFPGVAHGLVVSPEVRGAIADSPYGRAVSQEVFPNWFNDTGLSRPRVGRGPRKIERVGVVTNHLDPALAAALDRIQQRRGAFRWQHLGAPDHVTEITPAVLQGFDLVISIGRTVLAAAALGKPVLIQDVFGSDGLLDPARFDRIAATNFSGRAFAEPGSEAQLERALAEAEAQDLTPVVERIWTDYSLSVRLDRLEALYRELLERAPALSDADANAYQRGGAVHLESMQALKTTREHARNLEVVVATNSAEQRAVTRDRDEWRARCQADAPELEVLRSSGQQLAQARSRIAQIEQQLAEEKATSEALRVRGAQMEMEVSYARLLGSQVERSKTSLEQRLSEIESAASWQTIERMRAMRDAWFPEQSLRRNVIDKLRDSVAGALRGSK